MTKYLCVHCDRTFVHEGSKKPRCPECMRVNGLEEVAAPTGEADRQRPPWVLWAVAAAVLVGGAVAYALWAGEAADTVEGEAPLAPLDRGAVLGHLRAEGVDARQLNELLLPSEPVEAWAEEVAGSGDAEAKAQAILDAIRERASAGAFERWSFGIPRETPIAAPDQVLEWIQQDEGGHHLYPLELAALMASALRAVDVDAMVAEAIRFEGERRPPDPSGQLGYHLVAVYPGGLTEGAEPVYYDPYEGREVAPADARVLSDVQAIGAALSTRALYLLSRESDPERAMEASSQSLRLDGRSPAARAVRGAILLAAGQANEGLDELVSAKQLRTDAPRRNLLAGVHMAQGDLDAASREVSAALEEYPEFAPGRATLAAIHLSRQETDLARTELEQAERIDPDLHLLPQLWAEFYASTGEMDRAVQRAQQAVEQNGDLQTRLTAARIYRAAARYGLMRREAHAVLELAPANRESEMRQIIERMLGPTALEPIDEELADLDEDWDEDEALGLGDPDSLSLDSPLLGGDEGGGPSLLGGGSDGPSLLGDDAQLGGGGLQLGGGGGGLQLGGGGGSGLRLNLDE